MPVTLQFPACQKKLCVTVSIVDDGVVENDEEVVITVVSGRTEFRRVAATGPPDRISFGSGTANITIIDNDGELWQNLCHQFSVFLLRCCGEAEETVHVFS